MNPISLMNAVLDFGTREQEPLVPTASRLPSETTASIDVHGQVHLHPTKHPSDYPSTCHVFG